MEASVGSFLPVRGADAACASRCPVSEVASRSGAAGAWSGPEDGSTRATGASDLPTSALEVACRSVAAGASSGPFAARAAEALRRPVLVPEVVSVSTAAGASNGGEEGLRRVAGAGSFRMSAVVDSSGAGDSAMGVRSSRAASAIGSSAASVVAAEARTSGMVVSVIPRQSPPSSRRASIRRCWGKPAAGRRTNSSRTPPGAGCLVRPRMLHSRSARRIAKRARVPGWASERTRTRQAWVGARFSLGWRWFDGCAGIVFARRLRGVEGVSMDVRSPTYVTGGVLWCFGSVRGWPGMCDLRETMARVSLGTAGGIRCLPGR